MTNELSSDFTFEDVKFILEKNKRKVNEIIVAKVFIKAKIRAGFLEKGRHANTGFSDDRFSLTANDLLFWCDDELRKQKKEGEK